jgi:hypothetical protein
MKKKARGLQLFNVSVPAGLLREAQAPRKPNRPSLMSFASDPSVCTGYDTIVLLKFCKRLKSPLVQRDSPQFVLRSASPN